MTIIEINLRWFEAEFEGGRCGACNETIKRDMRIAYRGSGSNRMLVGYECCMGEGKDDGEPFELSGDDDAVAEEDGTLAVSNPAVYMPPGRTKQDSCPKCFVIHTIAQGDECQ